MQEKVDPVTGKSSRTIIESKSADVRPRISIKDEEGKTAKLSEVWGFRDWPATCCPSTPS